MQTIAIAGRLKDRVALEKSSSGGAFTALSDVFLENGDAVVASVYENATNILHFQIITDKKTRDMARGSKYFQSNPEEIFHESCDWLMHHPSKKLMFFGTGCQAESFRRYMDQQHFGDRVFTVDIICFGVPSQTMWRDYLHNKVGDAHCSDLTFKDKRNGWLHPSAIIHANGEEVKIDEFARIFYSKFALRPSCYHCPFTKFDRNTDITIGDCWGIDKTMPDFYDKMGNSLFLIHTERGKTVFDITKSRLDFRECSAQECDQSHLKKPTECPEKRASFWQLYHKKGVVAIVQKYAKTSFLKRFKRRIRKTLGGG